MRYLIPVCICVLLPLIGMANITPMGYASKKAGIWRYWEINAHNVPEPKMLVYNKSDTAIVFFMVLSQPKNGMTAEERSKLHGLLHIDNDTIIKPMTIQPHAYGIFNTEVAPLKGYVPMDILFVNGAIIGQAGIMQPFSMPAYEHRYYSAEGEQGMGLCIIGRDNLFSKRGKKDRMTLYFDRHFLANSINEVKLVPMTNCGFKSMTLYAGDGTECSIDIPEGKGGIPVSKAANMKGVKVDLQHIDAYKIDVEYTLAPGDVDPSFNLRMLYAGCNIGEQIPVIPKP